MIELFNVTSNTQDKIIDIPYLVLPNVGMIALVGPKDSGKSILLKVIAGIDSYKGKIIINQGLKHKKFTCNIGYLDFHTQRRFKTDNYIKALENTAMIYGIKNINKAIENSTRYLRAFDLTKNDSYENLDKARKTLFSLSILLSLDLPVILLDELYSNLDKKYEEKVEKILLEYSAKHLVLISFSTSPKLDLFNKVLLIKNGKIIKEAETKQEKFKSVTFRKNKNFDLGIFSVLPHLATRAKVFLIFLSVIFTFIVASLSESLNPNINAINTLLKENFTPISKVYEKYESYTFYDFSNNKITIKYNQSSANEFYIRPLINKNINDNSNVLYLSKSVALVLGVEKGDIVTISTKEFKVENIINTNSKEIYLPYTYYCLFGNNSSDTYYYLLSSDINKCTYYDSNRQEIDYDSTLTYYNYELNNISEDNNKYGYYVLENFTDNNLVLIPDNGFTNKPVNISTKYVIYYTSLKTLHELSEYEDDTFIFNKIKPSPKIIVGYVASVSLYLIITVLVFIRADKGDSDYYKSFSKQKYTFLQAIKFFSFTGIILLCTLILVSTLSRENILLALTSFVLLITLLLFLLTYMLLGRFSIKNE
jgi:cobalt ABC transporter